MVTQLLPIGWSHIIPDSHLPSPRAFFGGYKESIVQIAFVAFSNKTPQLHRNSIIRVWHCILIFTRQTCPNIRRSRQSTGQLADKYTGAIAPDPQPCNALLQKSCIMAEDVDELVRIFWGLGCQAWVKTCATWTRALMIQLFLVQLGRLLVDFIWVVNVYAMVFRFAPKEICRYTHLLLGTSSVHVGHFRAQGWSGFRTARSLTLGYLRLAFTSPSAPILHFPMHISGRRNFFSLPISHTCTHSVFVILEALRESITSSLSLSMCNTRHRRICGSNARAREPRCLHIT